MSTTPKHLIVHAEDDLDDRELLYEAFEKYQNHIELVSFTDGAGVLRYLSRLTLTDHSPCLIILDINLPILSGQEVLQQIRAIPQYAQTPVVFFTTSSQQRDQNFASNHSAGFITKPLTFRQMDMIAEQLLNACDKGVQDGIRNAII